LFKAHLSDQSSKNRLLIYVIQQIMKKATLLNLFAVVVFGAEIAIFKSKNRLKKR
jgi:hypothetical protein